MNTKLLTSSLILSAAIQVHAGGLEYTQVPVNMLFAEGENILRDNLLASTGSNSGDFNGRGTTGSAAKDTLRLP